MSIIAQNSKSQLCLFDTKKKEIHVQIERFCLNSRKENNAQFQVFVSFAFYKQIVYNRYFNLTDGFQSDASHDFFRPNSLIRLSIAVKLDLLPLLVKQAEPSPEATIIYLEELSQKQLKENSEDIHPLLQEQNWYCTAAKQQQPSGEVGYKTLWYYLLPAFQNPTSEAIADSITQYIQDQTAASFDQITQATEPLFKDIAQSFQDLFTTTLADLEAAEDAENSEQPSLLSIIKDFFEAEDWPYAQLSNSVSEDTTTLRLAFRGENGQWPCYVTVNQAQETACFYSISPATTPLEQRGAIAEFITRANYGLILGNFELDYTDGEIRYKTSIDVEGDRLSPALIHNLVYTNVLTMDQYLPGLMAVLEQGISPEQAIALVEQSQPATSAESATESNPIDRLVW